MAHRPAPHAHQVRLRNVATGQVYDAWPVDAREHLRHAGVESVPPGTPLGIVGEPGKPLPAPASAELAAAVPPPKALTVAEQLDGWSYKQLQELARRAGIDPVQKKVELIELLVPLVEAKAVSLEELPAVALVDQNGAVVPPAPQG